MKIEELADGTTIYGRSKICRWCKKESDDMVKETYKEGKVYQDCVCRPCWRAYGRLYG